MLTIEKTLGVCKSININRLGSEGEEKLILKARFEAVCEADAIRRVMGLETVPAFWDNDDELNPLYWPITNVTLEGKFKEQSLTFADVSFDSCEVSDIHFCPVPGARAAIQFTVKVAFPKAAKVAALAERLQEEFFLTVEAHPDLFEEGCDDE